MQRIATWCIAAALGLSACSREHATQESASDTGIEADAVAQSDEDVAPGASHASKATTPVQEPVSYVVEPGTPLPEPKATHAAYPEGAIAAKGKPVDDAILAEADAQLDAERKRPANADASNSHGP